MEEMKDRDRREQDKQRKTRQIESQADIQRAVQRLRALAHHIKNDTGRVPSRRTVSTGEQRQSNIASISG